MNKPTPLPKQLIFSVGNKVYHSRLPHTKDKPPINTLLDQNWLPTALDLLVFEVFAANWAPPVPTWLGWSGPDIYLEDDGFH